LDWSSVAYRERRRGALAVGRRERSGSPGNRYRLGAQQPCHSVLLQGTSMPRAKDLPGALAGLAQRNAFEIRDTHFDQDVAQLVDALVPTWWQKLGRTLQRRPIYSAAALLTIVLLGLWIYPKIALTPEQARIEIRNGSFVDARSSRTLRESLKLKFPREISRLASKSYGVYF